MSAPLDPRLAAYLQNVPASARQMLGRALSGTSKSPRDAIRAKCIECSGFARDEAAACTVWRCPLWHLNPYRAAPRLELALPEPREGA